MGEKDGPPVPTPSLSGRAVSPTPSDASGLLEKDSVSIACSPAPSNCSFLSEQEQGDGSFNSRQSPFLPANQPSPSSSFLSLPRPEYLNVSIPDSETSSRSSMDGIAPAGRHEYRTTRKRKNSSDSSSSEESIRTLGDLTDCETSSRKSSKTRLNEDGNLIVPGRGADAPRGRIANIRRESNCSMDSDAASERLVRATQIVSAGFDDMMSISQVPPSPRRVPPPQTVEAPISIVTNSFIPSSCSPSPTRISDKVKQCYSPSTQQIVRGNVPYSPSPSPTQSPTRQRLLSLSPICTKAALKRRYTAGNGEDMLEAKRQFAKNNTSPLVTDRSFPYPAPVQPVQSIGAFVEPPLPGALLAGVLSRKPPQLVESSERTPEYPRRTSMDSVSDDQKSVRDDLSEPSSVNQSDEIMEMDESEEQKKILEEALQVPLPPDDDDL